MRFLCAKYIATKEDGKNSVERLHISSSQFKNISILHSDMLCVIQNFEVKQKLFNEAFIYLLIYWTSRLALWRCTSLLCYFPHFPLGYIVSLSFYSTSSFIYQNVNSITMCVWQLTQAVLSMLFKSKWIYFPHHKLELTLEITLNFENKAIYKISSWFCNGIGIMRICNLY